MPEYALQQRSKRLRHNNGILAAGSTPEEGIMRDGRRGHHDWGKVVVTKQSPAPIAWCAHCEQFTVEWETKACTKCGEAKDRRYDWIRDGD